MKVIELDSWEQFEVSLKTLRAEMAALRKEKGHHYISTPLFRGQSDASWELKTTLDRVTDRPFGMEAYFRAIQAVRPAVISITGKEWDLPQTFDSEKSVPQGYEFMIYLRHHGFPSPLLDWTRSPYVAAYFAFRPYEKPQNGTVAIYSYVEYVGEGKSWTSGSPSIHGLGHYVISHKRHYAQQCEYTICKVRTDAVMSYTKHQLAIATSEKDQDQLTKYILPWAERQEVMRILHRMNVTAFSLFGSEESLMETLAFQEIEEVRE